MGFEKRSTPINVDFNAPKIYERNTKYGKLCRFLLRITNDSSLCYYFIRDTTYNDQINEQLKCRMTFPYEDWSNCFLNVSAVQNILKKTVAWIGRVNYHYIPEDLLLYLLWDDLDDETSEELSSAIENVCKFTITPEEIVRLAKQNITLKDFFQQFVE